MRKPSRGIQSIEVGGRLLDALVRSGEPMMLRDLAQAAGMAASKAHPYLVSFSRIGLIEQNAATGCYQFGPLALQLGVLSLRSVSVVSEASPLISALAARIDQAVSLSIWGTHGPTVVALQEPGHPVHIVMRVGSVMGLLETATGRAFSAFMPERAVAAARHAGLDRLGIGYDAKRTMHSPDVIRDLAEARRRGLARASGDPLPGVNALAAPAFDHSGAVVLAITAMGPAGTFDARWNGAVARELHACAREVSHRLGFIDRRKVAAAGRSGQSPSRSDEKLPPK